MSRRAGYLHSATNICTLPAFNQFVTIMMVLPLNGLLTSYIIWVWSSIYWLWQNWKCYLCIEQLLFYKAEWWVAVDFSLIKQSCKRKWRCWKNFHISCSGYGMWVVKNIPYCKTVHNVWINIHVFHDEFHQEQKQIPTHRQPPNNKWTHHNETNAGNKKINKQNWPEIYLEEENNLEFLKSMQ